MNKRFPVVLLLGIVGAAWLPSSALASTCSMLSYSVDDARTKLRRAATETELEDAKDQARRAKSALEDAASASMDCKCDLAYSEFDDAATRARRARDADDAEEFVEQINRSGHRKNILTPHWKREGIGVEVDPDDKVYITQNFCWAGAPGRRARIFQSPTSLASNCGSGRSPLRAARSDGTYQILERGDREDYHCLPHRFEDESCERRSKKTVS